jgi:sorting nexin-8
MIGDPPPLYLSILDQMDPSSTGTVSLSAAHRVLSTSKLPAATIEKVRPRLYSWV